MRPCRAVPPPLLLLLGLGLGLGLGLAGATTPAPDGSTPASASSVSPSPPGLWAVSYQDVVSAAVELLNARAAAPYVLRLREAQLQQEWSGDLQQRQKLSFTVEETTCRAPGMATASCKSRWLGAVSWCRGFVFLEQQQPTVELTCEKVPVMLGRFRTSRLADFFARIRERFRGFFQCSRIWIRDKLNLKNPKV